MRFGRFEEWKIRLLIEAVVNWAEMIEVSGI